MMQGHLSRLGKQVGIDFNFGGRTGNTRDSHRMIQLAKTKGEGMQTKVVEQLFNAYFEVNEDITDREVLIKRGVAAGLDEAEAREWMEGSKGGPEVDKEVVQAQEKFISGVPNFTYVRPICELYDGYEADCFCSRLNGKYEVQGAEEPQAFLQVFDEIKTDTRLGGTTGGGNNC
jgi:predicted DsbA family dithiol-disulfide isomerase